MAMFVVVGVRWIPNSGQRRRKKEVAGGDYEKVEQRPLNDCLHNETTKIKRRSKLQTSQQSKSIKPPHERASAQ
jgi:hypothetical protein